MGTEIERRFLLKDPRWRPSGVAPVQLDQGRFFFGEDAEGAVTLLFGLPLFSLRLSGRAAPSLHTFLSAPDAWSLALSSRHVSPAFGGIRALLPQGWAARIRAYDRQQFVMDIKGPRTGTTRAEFGEFRLPPPVGLHLLEATPAPSRLSKERYSLPHAGHTWVLDVYSGDKQHYQPTCEVELSAADVPLPLPPWVGEEITHRKTFTSTSPRVP